MKRYRFRLEAVLRVRRVQEDLARQKVALAAADVARAEEQIDRAVEAYHEVSDVHVLGGADALARARFVATWRAAGIGRAQARRDQAEHVRGERVDEWRSAARAVEVLERLDQRRRQEHAVAVRRHEDDLVDDLVSGRHGISRFAEEGA